MGDVLEVERALAFVEGFHPVQRILLTCTGTLQGTLSAWFGGPMEIHVVDQGQEDAMVFNRKIEMRYEGQCIMEAESVVTTTREDVRGLVKARELGIGQIMEKLGIRPEFKLLVAGQDDESFWRVYKLFGSGVTYRIKEVFPQCYYKSVVESLAREQLDSAQPQRGTNRD